MTFAVHLITGYIAYVHAGCFIYSFDDLVRWGMGDKQGQQHTAVIPYDTCYSMEDQISDQNELVIGILGMIMELN